MESKVISDRCPKHVLRTELRQLRLTQMQIISDKPEKGVCKGNTTKSVVQSLRSKVQESKVQGQKFSRVNNFDS